MGEEGFRDAELKMLVNELRKKGYDLYDNTEAPGWKWTWNEDLDGFELEDSPELNDYVEELPIRTCDSKTGSSEISSAVCQPPPDKEGVIMPMKDIGESARHSIRLFPNPVAGNKITLVVLSEIHGILEWRITDPMGNLRGGSKLNIVPGENVETIENIRYVSGSKVNLSSCILNK